MKRLIATLYSYRVLSDLMVIYPLFALLLSNHNLSTIQISWLLGIWSATAIIFEVPSGVWADRFPRHIVLASAEIIRAIGWLIWLLLPTFTGFAIGFVCWGLKNALVSGTFQALTYDELAQIKQEGRYLKVNGTAESLSLIAIVISTLLSSLVVRFGFGTVIIASIVTGIMAAAAIGTLPPAKSVAHAQLGLKAIFTNGLRIVASSRVVLFLLAFGGFVGCLFGALGNYTTLFIKNVGWSLGSIPIHYAWITLLLAAVAYSSYRFKKIRFPATLFIMLAAAIALILGTIHPNLASILYLGLYLGLFKALVVVYDSKLQHAIESESRATVSSLKGIVEQAGSLGVYALFGLFSGLGGLLMSFRYFGFVIVAATVVFGLSYLWGFRSRSARLAS